MNDNSFFKNTHRYDDIIDMEYPLKDSDAADFVPMDINERAKIFAPFAALKGYGDTINDTADEFIQTPEYEFVSDASYQEKDHMIDPLFDI